MNKNKNYGPLLWILFFTIVFVSIGLAYGFLVEFNEVSFALMAIGFMPWLMLFAGWSMFNCLKKMMEGFC